MIPQSLLVYIDEKYMTFVTSPSNGQKVTTCSVGLRPSFP